MKDLHQIAELRQMDAGSLELLAAELREELVEVITAVGGHFAPSLGVVELTLALHYCFETPDDRLVWDVGHQAYIHKMLTGRRELLGTIRTRGGLSGYLKRSESHFDTFGAGHAGTSISAAAGIASEFRRRGNENYVVSVIGDGSLTAGMAFEALNQVGGAQLERFIVVLNDNGMSIAENVGALAQQSELRGFFETLGFSYLGPSDGHCVSSLLEALNHAKTLQGPVVLHVKTVKGKGVERAEADPLAFHALKPPCQATVRELLVPPTYSEVFGQTMSELARQDPRVIAVTAAMPGGTGLSRFAKEFPNSFFDVGISEQHAVTFAAGLACEGARPFCAIYSSFLQRGFDQVLHDVCIQNLPVVFALDRSGVVGNDGETHQGVFDIAYLRSIPNLALYSPKDENELQHMLFTALMREGPSAIRYPRGRGVGVPMDDSLKELPIGRGELVAEGDDALLIALGPLVHTALTIRQQLQENFGINVAVLNPRFVKPLDTALFAEELPYYPLVCTIEDHSLMAGFGSAVLELVNDLQIPLQGSLRRFGVNDAFVSHASPAEQQALHRYDPDTIMRHIINECSLYRTKKVA